MTAVAEPPTGPPAVSRFEYNLLRILRFLLGHMPAEQAAPLVAARFKPGPPCLGRTCVRLVQDTLAKGTILQLVRAGGWRDERFLRGLEPANGRVWDRLPLDARRLEFGPAVVTFLVRLTADHPADPHDPVLPVALTAGDELFFAMALDALRALPDFHAAVVGRAVFRQNPLCWLKNPGDFAAAGDPAVPDFTPWVTGPRAAILECLQPVLTRNWLRSERTKGQIGDWSRMRQQGNAEATTLAAFLAAADRAGRPDLARFVLRTASALLTTGGELTPAFWTGGLHGQGPPRLADRLEVQRAALAFVRQVEVLAGWSRNAAGVGYFDEEYQTSQLWKADWEAAQGDVAAERARRVVASLEPLQTAQGWRGPIKGERP